jgi:hypothetical protein
MKTLIVIVMISVFFSFNAFAQTWETTPEKADSDLEAQFNKAPSDQFDFTKAKEWQSGNTKYKFAPFLATPVAELKDKSFCWSCFGMVSTAVAMIAGGTALIACDYAGAFQADVTHITPTGTYVTGKGGGADLTDATPIGATILGTGLVGLVSYIIYEAVDDADDDE